MAHDSGNMQSVLPVPVSQKRKQERGLVTSQAEEMTFLWIIMFLQLFYLSFVLLII